MTTLPQIKATGLELTAAIREYVEKKTAMLEKYYPQIINIAAEVDVTTHHHHKGRIFRAELNVRVPGKLIRVEKTADDLYKAIDKVKDHMALMLKGHKEKKQDRVRRTQKRK